MKADPGDVFRLAELQRGLLGALRAAHPDARDFSWLLDFPAAGELTLRGERWSFVRHGAGVRFVRADPAPNLVVDAQRSMEQPNLVDSWRLMQFLESGGRRIPQALLRGLLEDMCRAGQLARASEREYLVEPPAD